VFLADQRLHLLNRHGICVATRVHDLLGLAQHPVVRARLAHLHVHGMSLLIQQLVQIGEVLGLFYPIEHDLPTRDRTQRRASVSSMRGWSEGPMAAGPAQDPGAWRQRPCRTRVQSVPWELCLTWQGRECSCRSTAGQLSDVTVGEVWGRTVAACGRASSGNFSPKLPLLATRQQIYTPFPWDRRVR
jgi:hypothetical protein